jgi:hypothetical protein
VLVFWHKRDLAVNEAIYVDVMRPAHQDAANSQYNTARVDWTPIWSYSYNVTTGKNLAWERVEINMRAAIENAIAATDSNLSWTGLFDNTNPYDDDFYIRIRLDARTNAAVADGVYVDGIDMRNDSPVSYVLAATGGDGKRYTDDIDNPSDWWTRWRTASWVSTASDPWKSASMPYVWWKSHSASAALTGSSPTASGGYRTPYSASTFSVLELTKIIDLTKAKTSDDPTMYFWNHYFVGKDAAIRVEVAVEDASRKLMGYDYIYGWGTDASYDNGSSWETLEEWERVGTIHMDTWIREQISLKNYVGKRIRLRFVVDAFEAATSLGDGWYIDDLTVELRTPVIMAFPFVDQAKNTTNWITEGVWGLDPYQFLGGGGTPASLGPDKWHGYFMQCLNNGNNVVTCSNNQNPANADSFLNRLKPTVADMDNFVKNLPETKALQPKPVDTINYDLGESYPEDATSATWKDQYTARWIRKVTLPAGQFSFTIQSDDGVRMRYEEASKADVTWPYTWNLLNRWNDHARTVDKVNFTVTGGDYNMVLE